MPKRIHEKLMNIALSRVGVKKEYDSLKDEFNLIREMVKARLNAGKTQEEIAEAMGTTTSVVGRLETGGGKNKHAPTLSTLQKYAQALNCKLVIKLVPINDKISSKNTIIKKQRHLQ